MPLRATQCVDHCKCYIVKRLRASRAEIEDARFAWVIKKPEIADKSYSNFKKAIEGNSWTSAKATGADKANIEQHAVELGELGSQFIDLQTLYFLQNKIPCFFEFLRIAFLLLLNLQMQ